MGWTFSIVNILVFTSAGMALVLGFLLHRYRSDPIVWPLSVLMFAVAAWSLPHAISLGYTDLDQVIFWHRLRYPGIVIAPVAYLVVALRYGGYERWLSKRTYALLGVIPLLSTIIVWTNPIHGLQWQSFALVRVNGASVLVETFGPWRAVNLGYLYLVTAAGLIVLATSVVRSESIYRKQAILMFIGGVIPLGLNVVANVDIGPDPRIDFTASALTITGLTFALALFHFDLLEIQPIAREKLIDELDDGVVVIGPEGTIRDFNPLARRILGDITVGQPADEVLPAQVFPDGGEIVVETNGEVRRFQTRATELTDNRGAEIGRVVYMNDITELVEREQRISVLNRILRHNIRNELNIIDGHMEQLEPHVAADGREPLETAKAGTRRVIDMAEKARLVERTLQEQDPPVVVSAAAVADQVVAEAQERFPDSDIGIELSEEAENGLAVRVVDEKLFETAIAELVENAVLHNDRESPQVTVRVEAAGDVVNLRVADDGPGIHDLERTALTLPTETALEHGSGLGLWLVQWTASHSSGTLSFAENDPRGTVVTLTLPSAGE